MTHIHMLHPVWWLNHDSFASATVHKENLEVLFGKSIADLYNQSSELELELLWFHTDIGFRGHEGHWLGNRNLGHDIITQKDFSN